MLFASDLSRLRHVGVTLRDHFLRGLDTRLCVGQLFVVILSVLPDEPALSPHPRS